MTGYTKLAASILDSTIWREDGATRLLWITMLAMAGREGIVEASIPGLADRARITIAETELALSKLAAPDVYSRTKDHAGRRIEAVDGGWLLLNHAKYRRLLSAEERREYQRQWQADKRQTVNTCQQVSTPVNTCQQSTVLTQAEAEAEAEAEAVQKHTEDAPRPVHVNFVKPVREELDLYATKIGLPVIEADKFWNYYESNGWKVGKNPMRSWRAALTNWKLRWEENREKERATGKPQLTTFAQAQARQIAEMKHIADKAIAYDPSRPL